MGKRSAASDERSERIARSGMIQPGSKPQFQKDTPLDKVTRGVGRVVRAVASADSARRANKRRGQ